MDFPMALVLRFRARRVAYLVEYLLLCPMENAMRERPGNLRF